MRINEILIESQLNEEILTELDWSKIKKGLATGAITLGALGISGNAMAQHFKVDNASKIKDSQVVKYVQDKVDTGEIKPAVVKQAVQKVDTAPVVKPTTPEPKQDIKPEIKKVEPKVDVKKTEPTKTDSSAQSDALKQVEKNPEINKGLSQFSIKGLRFGMSFDEVVKISGAERSVNAPVPSYWFNAAKDLSIAGETNWTAIPTGELSGGDTKGELGFIFTKIDPDNFEAVVKRFSQQYGKPEITTTDVRNKMNYSDTNITASWKVKDATIIIKKYNGKFTEGVIRIFSDKYTDDATASYNSKKDKASKDF